MKKTKKMALIGVLGALACIVMMFEIPFPLAPWLKFDLSDIVVLFGGLVGGIGSAVAITFVRVILNFLLQGTSSAGIGEATSILATLAYVIPVIVIYNRMRNIWIGLAIGTISLTLIMLISNYLFITPFYAKLYKMDFILEMMKKNDGSYLKYIIYYYGSFNMFKGIIISAIYGIINRSLKNRYVVV